MTLRDAMGEADEGASELVENEALEAELVKLADVEFWGGAKLPNRLASLARENHGAFEVLIQ